MLGGNGSRMLLCLIMICDDFCQWVTRLVLQLVAWSFGLRIKLWKLTEYRRIVYLVPCRSPLVQTCMVMYMTVSYNFIRYLRYGLVPCTATRAAECEDGVRLCVIFIHVFRMQTLWSIVRLTNFSRSRSLIQTSCDMDNSKQGIGIHEPPSHLPLTQWLK